MKYFIRNIQAATFILIASISHAYGDYGNPPSFEENQCCYSCQEPSSKGFICADLIYWRAFEGGLDTCVPRRVSDTTTSEGFVTSRFNGRSKDPHFQWEPGFRIGTGYGKACSNLDVEAYWTHFHSNSHGSKNGNRRRWRLNFDVVDVVVGYQTDLNSCFVLKPFAGLRGAKIDQKLHINESPLHEPSSSSSSSTLLDVLITSNRRNKEEFTGVGPLLGVEGDFKIGCSLSLYATGAVSWMYGHFDVRLIENDETEDTQSFCKVTKHLEACVTAADIAFGVRWHKCFCNNMRLVLQLGLEHHRYFDFNRIGAYGDLSFDGVSLSAGVDF